MNYFARLLLIFSVIYFGTRALAEVNPSTAVLLNTSSAATVERSDAPDVNLESGRYTIKAEAQTKVVPKAHPVATPAAVQVAAPPAAPTAPSVVQASAPTPLVAPISDETYAQRIRDLILGDQEEANKYRGSLHPDDRRQNLVEVSLAPTFSYIDSSSEYSFRRYSSQGSGVTLGLEFWMTPFLGLTSSYFTTLAADMSAGPGEKRELQVDHRFFDVGFQFRKFFNLTRKSPVAAVSVKYDEYVLTLPKKEDARTRLKTTGVALGFEAKLPTTVTHAWHLGSEIILRPSAKEEATALKLKSGSHPTAQTLKFSFGSDYTFSQKQSVYWKLSHRLDKVVYEGKANVADPKTGTAPEGVSVNQGATMFEFGFTWGG